VGPYKDVEFPVWRGVVAPKTMSPAAVKFWSEAFKKVSETEAWKNDYIAKYKLQPAYMDAAQAKAFMAEFQATYLKKIGLNK
jgi:putative tricarboxylic transport membrane protein